VLLSPLSPRIVTDKVPPKMIHRCLFPFLDHENLLSGPSTLLILFIVLPNEQELAPRVLWSVSLFFSFTIFADEIPAPMSVPSVFLIWFCSASSSHVDPLLAARPLSDFHELFSDYSFFFFFFLCFGRTVPSLIFLWVFFPAGLLLISRRRLHQYFLFRRLVFFPPFLCMSHAPCMSPLGFRFFQARLDGRRSLKLHWELRPSFAGSFFLDILQCCDRDPPSLLPK